MKHPGTTCWTVIQLAAAGEERCREEFARRYGTMFRAYLAARWRKPGEDGVVDEGVQEVFLECFKSGGVLDRVAEDRPKELRAFLYGVVRNVARHIERRWAANRELSPHSHVDLNDLERSEATLSEVFDRAWAQSIVQEAAALQTHQARKEGEEGLQRVRLLQLRFTGGLPIRDIARSWKMDARRVHHLYERARRDFKRALLKVVRFHHPDSPSDAKKELSQVLASLGGAVPEDPGGYAREQADKISRLRPGESGEM